MPATRYRMRCQTIGVRTINCGRCGLLNRIRWHRAAWRFTCRVCRAEWGVGTAIFEILPGAHRPPADLAIPRTGPDADTPIPITSADDAPSDVLLEPFELTIDVGAWRTNECITLEVPDPTIRLTRQDIWRELATGRLWAAIPFAITRMVAEPIDGGPSERIYVHVREWRVRMARIAETPERRSSIGKA